MALTAAVVPSSASPKSAPVKLHIKYTPLVPDVGPWIPTNGTCSHCWTHLHISRPQPVAHCVCVSKAHTAAALTPADHYMVIAAYQAPYVGLSLFIYNIIILVVALFRLPLVDIF